MVSFVEHQFDATLDTDLATSEVFVFVLHTQDPDIYGQGQQDVFQIFFCLVHHYFIHEPSGWQLYLSFHNALYRWILAVGSVNGGIGLQSCYEIVAVIFGFGQHGYVSSVQEIKGTECYTYLHASVF